MATTCSASAPADASSWTTVDGGTVQRNGKEESHGIEVKLHGDRDNPTEATQDGRTEKATYFPFTGQHTLLGMAQRLDGCLYLLVRTQGDGVALDRYDPTRVALERLPLHLEIGDALTMAAGRDALYLAAGDGRKGRWRIDWDVLDLARWQKIANARIDDVAAKRRLTPLRGRPRGSGRRPPASHGTGGRGPANAGKLPHWERPSATQIVAVE